jgi:hypothetical protein
MDTFSACYSPHSPVTLGCHVASSIRQQQDTGQHIQTIVLQKKGSRVMQQGLRSMLVSDVDCWQYLHLAEYGCRHWC